MRELIIDIRAFNDEAILRIEHVESHKALTLKVLSVWPTVKTDHFHFQSKIDEETLLHFLREK